MDVLKNNIRKYTDQEIEKNESKKDVAQFIHLEGTTSCSHSYKVALDFARSTDQTKQRVLFVVCVQNYFGIGFFRMSSSSFTAHPDEQEVLLTEGKRTWVIGFDEITVNSDAIADTFWQMFNGKTITVVYLFTK